MNSQSWIPACAGMTEMSELLTKQAVLDPMKKSHNA
jgi:hypothetical protein